MQRLSLFLLWIVIQICVPLVAIRMLYAIITHPDRAYKMAVVYDKLGNAALNDEADETISVRAYKASLEGKKWGCYLCKFLNIFQKEHCRKATEE